MEVVPSIVLEVMVDGDMVPEEMEDLLLIVLQVVVEVEVLKEGQEKDISKYGPVVQFYLGFPLREGKAWGKVKEGVAFRLRLRFPQRVGDLEVAEELEAALWAWETFGGIGARTRRGFGAILREGSRPPGEEAIREGLAHYSREGGWPEGVPHLTPKSLVRVVRLSWGEVAERYQAFRQARSGGSPKSPGRSSWPEPDEIRRLTQKYLPTHAPRHPVRKFPRAHFGLPIIFHFRDKGDPPDTTLKLPQAERRASPLLFRPLGERLSLVAVLEGPRFPEKRLLLTFKGPRNKNAWEVDPWLTPQEATKIEVLRGETDPLRAFVKSL